MQVKLITQNLEEPKLVKPHTLPPGKAFCRKPHVLSMHDQMAVTVLSFH